MPAAARIDPAALLLIEGECRRRGLDEAKASRPWLTIGPDPEPGRFAFTFDLAASSPLEIDAAEEVDYRREIVAWSHAYTGQQPARVERPSHYHYIPPNLYPAQREAIFSPARSVYIEASTKAGKSAGSMARLLEAALCGRPGQSFWWVAPVYSQARMMMRRLERAIPRQVYAANRTDMIVELPNGAAIYHKSGDKPDTLYGEDVAGVVIDEASRVKRESRYAIESTLTATGGWLVAIGNVRGRRNWFYEAAQKARAGDGTRTSYARLTWRDAVAAGIVDEATIEDARGTLPPAVFRELYEAEAAENAANPFGTEEQITACAAPLSDGAPVVWGWDLAKSQDWTVGIAFDDAGRACRFLRFQRDWKQTKETILRETGNARAYVDSTGVGDPIVEDLRRSNPQIEGFHFSAPSKQRLMEGLASWVQERRGTYPNRSVGPVLDEMLEFEYTYSRGGVRYSAPEGFHDDCVCALALVVAASGRPSTSPIAYRVRRGG